MCFDLFLPVLCCLNWGIVLVEIIVKFFEQNAHFLCMEISSRVKFHLNYANSRISTSVDVQDNSVSVLVLLLKHIKTTAVDQSALQYILTKTHY